MAIEPYGIGGVEVKTDAFEAFADIPQNRVLLAEKLTKDPPVKPEIVTGLTDIESVFEHFGPEVEMEFETEEGMLRRETLRFGGLEDFGVKGITAQSPYLNELDWKQQQYHKMIRQLKTNKLLKQALANKDTKDALIRSLQALVAELKATQ
ncbi:hypothetical protein [Puia sp.]|jgi:hypothetical protein|uniref:hypothetical protein n=1 Tax=Puia sp. TaxID=2045100 RepID=UPI002F40CB50